MFQSSDVPRQIFYHPSMDGRNFGEHICVSGNNLMTLAEKKQLIKYQLNFVKKDSGHYIEMASPSMQFQRFPDTSHSLGNQAFETLLPTDKMKFSKNKYISTVPGFPRINTTCPRILINVHEYSLSVIQDDFRNQILLGSKLEFKYLLFLIEQLYYLYFQIECLKDVETLVDQRRAFTLKLQGLLGFNPNLNSILPLKLMCVRKGCSLIHSTFNILDLSNQGFIITLFIDHLSSFLPIYCQVDPNENLYSHLINILPLFTFEILHSFAKKLIIFLDTSKNFSIFCHSKIPMKLLSLIRNLLESKCKETKEENYILLYRDLTLSQSFK